MQKVSVIVPIYNCEETLEKCINSILKQKEFIEEIVLVNDGSVDNSKDIAEKYSKENALISFYNKEHTGVADTRNYGIDKVKGDYFLFVDCDDYIDENLIKNMQKYLENDTDLIKFKLVRVDENGLITEKVDGACFNTIDGEEAFAKLYPTDKLLDSPCVYLFRTKYIKENNFKFNTGTFHEDFGLIPIIITCAKTVTSVKEYGYYYVQKDGSITRNSDYTKTIKKMKDSLSQYDRMIEIIKHKNISNTAKDNLKIFYTNAILNKLKELRKKELNDFINEIKKRNMVKNIKVRNIRQLVKKILLNISIKMYIKIV